MNFSSILKAGSMLSLLVVIILSSYLLHRQQKIFYYDLDGDWELERIVLDRGLLRIWNQDLLIYTSNIDWEVTLIKTGDANNDGRVELVIGFWRYGDYGPDNEYARIRRDPKESYHLYLYQYDKNSPNLRLIWGSSTLNDPIYDMEIVKVGNENQLEITTGTYAEYDATGEITPYARSLWVWDDWYFTKLQDL